MPIEGGARAGLIQPDKKIFDYLKKHRIEPIICPMRHRYFWDGGIHCFTLDLQRKGSRENYF